MRRTLKSLSICGFAISLVAGCADPGTSKSVEPPTTAAKSEAGTPPTKEVGRVGDVP